jgi:hypothetical protein
MGSDFVDPRISTPGADSDSDERFENQPPSFTGAQSLTAAFNKGYDGIGDSISRMITMSGVKDTAADNPFPKTNVNDLNKQYPNLQQPFTEDTDPFIAGEIARRQQEKKDQESAVANGPQSGLYSVGRFGAGMLAGASDPLFAVAAAVTMGASEAALAGTAAGDALGLGIEKQLVWDTAKQGVKYGSKTLLQNAATGAIEGAGASAIAEPFKAAADSQDNTPYNFRDAAGRVGMGALSFGILKPAGAAFYKLLRPEQIRILETVANNRLASDKIPDVSALEHDFAMEQTGHVNPESGKLDGYNFKKLEDPNGTHFFVPKDAVMPSYKDGPMLKVGDDLGSGGVHMTDNPQVANGIAAPKVSAVPGSVHEVSFEGKKLENIDQFSSPEFTDAAKAAIENQGLKFDPTTRTGKQILSGVMDEIHGDGTTPNGEVQARYNDFLQRLQFESKIRGVDGYQYKVGETGGIEHEPYNAAYLFDKDNLTEHGVAQANPDTVYKPDAKTATDILNKTQEPFEGTMFHNPSDQAAFDGSMNTDEVAPADQSAIEQQLNDNISAIKRQVEQFPDLPGAKSLLEEFKDVDADTNTSEKLIQNAFDCFSAQGGE